MGFLRSLGRRIGTFLDRFDERVDKPAKDRGTYPSGSEQLVDSEMAEEKGRATSDRRSGYGGGL